MDRIFKIHCSSIWKIMSNGKIKGELSETCKTFLHEWYANKKEEVHSKYIDKGNWCEKEVIDMAADVLGFGFADKNLETKEDEYFIGTCDVLMPEVVIDTKAVWDKASLDSKILKGHDIEYEWQGVGYMRLYNKSNFVLFYGLVDTPEEVNYGTPIEFNLPIEKRWVAYEFSRNLNIENEIIERVKLCRNYLENYDKIINQSIGTNIICKSKIK